MRSKLKSISNLSMKWLSKNLSASKLIFRSQTLNSGYFVSCMSFIYKHFTFVKFKAYMNAQTIYFFFKFSLRNRNIAFKESTKPRLLSNAHCLVLKKRDNMLLISLCQFTIFLFYLLCKCEINFQ